LPACSQRSLSPSASGAQPGPHARDQLGHGERLEQVVGGAEVEALDPGADVADGRQDQHPLSGLVRHQAAQHGHAVDARKQQVEHHQLVAALAGQLEPSLAVGGAVDDEARRRERARDQPPDPRLVVDHQYARHGRPLRLWQPTHGSLQGKVRSAGAELNSRKGDPALSCGYGL